MRFDGTSFYPIVHRIMRGHGTHRGRRSACSKDAANNVARIDGGGPILFMSWRVSVHWLLKARALILATNNFRGHKNALQATSQLPLSNTTPSSLFLVKNQLVRGCGESDLTPKSLLPFRYSLLAFGKTFQQLNTWHFFRQDIHRRTAKRQ